MIKYLDKWLQTIKVSWIKYTTYRMNFFLQIIGPTLIFFLVKFNLWKSIYNNDPNLIIKSFSLSSMLQYHAWAMVVLLLSLGHTSMNLSEDIRLGRISTYLIYPFNFWEFHTAGFLSFQILQSMICFIFILILPMLGFMHLPNFSTLFLGYFYCMFVSIFWFSLQYLTGLLAFWLEETWILRVLLQMVTSFLSGAIIPLDLYPKIFVDFLIYTPFPYLTYFPIKLFMGHEIQLLTPMLVLSIWLTLIIMLNKYLWAKGLKLYTAAGI